MFNNVMIGVIADSLEITVHIIVLGGMLITAVKKSKHKKGNNSNEINQDK